MHSLLLRYRSVKIVNFVLLGKELISLDNMILLIFDKSYLRHQKNYSPHIFPAWSTGRYSILRKYDRNSTLCPRDTGLSKSSTYNDFCAMFNIADRWVSSFLASHISATRKVIGVIFFQVGLVKSTPHCSSLMGNALPVTEIQVCQNRRFPACRNLPT